MIEAPDGFAQAWDNVFGGVLPVGHLLRGAFDDLFSALADDQERALFFEAESGRVLARYDGGFDLIWKDVPEREASRHRHVDWLAAHP